MNIDTDVFEDQEAAIDAALVGSQPGDRITVCRGDWSSCPNGATCPMCAVVIVREGITARDILDAAKVGHA